MFLSPASNFRISVLLGIFPLPKSRYGPTLCKSLHNVGNYDYLCAFFRTHLPEIPVTKLEGTYLVWTDCRALHLPSDTLQTRLLETTGLWLNSGTMYGAEGEGFLRWNIACPRSVLQDALSRFKGFVDALTKEE